MPAKKVITKRLVAEVKQKACTNCNRILHELLYPEKSVAIGVKDLLKDARSEAVNDDLKARVNAAESVFQSGTSTVYAKRLIALMQCV